MDRLVLLVSVLAVLGCAMAQRGLPYPLQYFYLSPNDAATVLAQHAAATGSHLTSKYAPSYVNPSYVAIAPARIGPAAGHTPAATVKLHLQPTAIPPAAVKAMQAQQQQQQQDEQVETAHFHTQDATGRSVFGFLTPDQTRVETRGRDGSVRGAYSYFDPTGRAVKVQYWDDGAGFHTAGNNLPGSLLTLPMPVRDTAEVQAAREEHLKLFEQVLLQRPILPQRPEPVADDQRESVIVESDNHPAENDDDDDGELTQYPNLQDLPQSLYDPSQVHDANRDAVIVDASDDVDSNRLRTGKSSNLDKSQEISSKSVKPQDDRAKEGASKSSQQSDEQKSKAILAPVENHGFFYSFTHSVPIFVQVKTVEDDKQADSERVDRPATKLLSLSQKAAYFDAIPVAALHALQMPPDLRGQQVVKPLYTEQVGEGTRPLSYSEKAAYFHAIPVAAIHDQQTHPSQKGAANNPQTQPVYVESN